MCLLFYRKKIDFLKGFIYLFLELERKGGRKRENVREIHRSVASSTPPTRDLACKPGMGPDWELNWQPLSLQAGAQSTEPHQPGHKQAFWPTQHNSYCLEVFWRLLPKTSKATIEETLGKSPFSQRLNNLHHPPPPYCESEQGFCPRSVGGKFV